MEDDAPKIFWTDKHGRPRELDDWIDQNGFTRNAKFKTSDNPLGIRPDRERIA